MKSIYHVILITSILTGSVFSETLRLASVDWPPFYSKSLVNNGFYAEISKEAFRRGGYEMSITFLPWARALREASTGNFDGLLGAYYSDDREKSFIYTDPVAFNDEVFVTKADSSINTLDEALVTRISGMRATVPVEELKATGIQVVEVGNMEQSIIMLYFNRVDVLVGGHFEFLSQLEKITDSSSVKLSDFRIISPPYSSLSLHNPITKKRKDAVEIVNAFNLGLTSMKKDGTYQSLLMDFRSLELTD